MSDNPYSGELISGENLSKLGKSTGIIQGRFTIYEIDNKRYLVEPIGEVFRIGSKLEENTKE